MKHFTVLSKLEDTMYEIDKVRANLRILAFSINENLFGTTSEEIQIVISDLDDRMSDNIAKMKENFYQLWSDVREDSFLTQDEQDEYDEEASARWGQIVSGMEVNLGSAGTADTIVIDGAGGMPTIDLTDLAEVTMPDDGILANPRGEDQSGVVA